MSLYAYEYKIRYILAALLLAFCGFAAIGCFRASPYDGIYILKNYSKLTAKIRDFFSKIQFFSRIIQIDQSVPEKIGFKHTNIGTYIGTYINRVAIV